MSGKHAEDREKERELEFFRFRQETRRVYAISRVKLRIREHVEQRARAHLESQLQGGKGSCQLVASRRPPPAYSSSRGRVERSLPRRNRIKSGMAMHIYIYIERGGFDSSSKNEPRLKIHRTQIVSSTIREFRFIHLRVSAIPFLLLLLFCTFISSYNLLLSHFASDF